LNAKDIYSEKAIEIADKIIDLACDMEDLCSKSKLNSRVGLLTFDNLWRIKNNAARFKHYAKKHIALRKELPRRPLLRGIHKRILHEPNAGALNG
jgi:hypothetical protein